LKKAYELLARIYWKINRIKLRVMIDRELEFWSSKKNEIIDNCKSSYSTDIESLGIELPENEKQFKVLGEIDEYGRLLSQYKITGRPEVSKHGFVNKERNDVYLVSAGGKAAIKKIYRKNKVGFIKELKGLYLANLGGCNVPGIIDIDFNELYIIFSYIDGIVLQDVNKLKDKNTIYEMTLNQINKVHEQGIFFNDLTSKNIVINPKRGPFIIDFEYSAHKSELGIFFDYFTKLEKERTILLYQNL
jgi:predicted Ser/Thr protein kinase